MVATLNTLLCHLDLGALVPPVHARFEPLVRDGVHYFLQALNPARRQAIVAEQLSLPATADTPLRLALVLQSCPTLHKLGQILARDQRLTPGVRRSLERLESGPLNSPFERITKLIYSEIGGVAGLTLADHALAEASVAVIVPFKWRPESGATASGVLKVLKPDVEEHLEEEIAIWTTLAPYLEERSTHHGLPAVDYPEIIESMTGHLRREVQLGRERERLQWAAGFYAGNEKILIPELFNLSSRRVTAMERVYGSKITDTQAALPGGAWRLCTLLVNELLARPFFSNHPSTCLHADPHPGNLLLTDDGRIAILDWCQVVELDITQRRSVMQVVLGALSLDEDRICLALARLAGGQSNKALMRSCVKDALGAVSKGAVPGMQWLLALFDALVMTRALNFHDELLLLRKGLHNLNEVADSLYPGFPLDTPLLQRAGTQLVQELPERMLSLDPNLTLGVPVSGSDFYTWWATMPLTFNRAWAYYTRLLLDRDREP